MVDYNPQQDPSIPCADAGVSFRRGDILEIVDQTDALWWQARKLPSDASCAGLIPSSNLLTRSDLTDDCFFYFKQRLISDKTEHVVLTEDHMFTSGLFLRLVPRRFFFFPGFLF